MQLQNHTAVSDGHVVLVFLYESSVISARKSCRDQVIMVSNCGVSMQAFGKRSVTIRYAFLKVQFGIRKKDGMPRGETGCQNMIRNLV